MEQDYRLAEGEYRFACLVWANEPVGSGQLVARANEALGWKKSRLRSAPDMTAASSN